MKMQEIKEMSVFYHSIYNINTAAMADVDTGLAGLGLVGLVGLVGLIIRAK